MAVLRAEAKPLRALFQGVCARHGAPTTPADTVPVEHAPGMLAELGLMPFPVATNAQAVALAREAIAKTATAASPSRAGAAAVGFRELQWMLVRIAPVVAERALPTTAGAPPPIRAVLDLIERSGVLARLAADTRTARGSRGAVGHF